MHMYIYLTCCPYSSVDEYLGNFYIPATVNNVIINMGVQVSLQDPDFSPLDK